jgi:hypothetical protein
MTEASYNEFEDDFEDDFDMDDENEELEFGSTDSKKSPTAFSLSGQLFVKSFSY